MRPGLVAAVVLAAGALAAPALATPRAPAPPACSPALAAWRPHVAAARAYAAARRGEVSFSVRTADWRRGFRARRTVPTASVFKALLLVAYLRRDGVRDRPLRRADRALLDPMIRRSDNVAATRVRDIVGSAAVRRLGRVAHLPSLRVAEVWGLSRLDAEDASRFFLALPELVPARHRAAALDLLATITPSQRWGIGRLRLPGWRRYFKGGWGSGTGAVDHQAVLLENACGARIAVAVMTTAQGTHAYGKATLEGTFRRLLRGLPSA